MLIDRLLKRVSVRRRSLKKAVISLLAESKGATAIEYVLLLATITLVGVAAAGQIADVYKDQADTLDTTLSDAQKRTTQPSGNIP